MSASDGKLVLHIKKGETVLIDGGISITVKNVVSMNRVELFFQAPKEIVIHRKGYVKKEKSK